MKITSTKAGLRRNRRNRMMWDEALYGAYKFDSRLLDPVSPRQNPLGHKESRGSGGCGDLMKQCPSCNHIHGQHSIGALKKKKDQREEADLKVEIPMRNETILVPTDFSELSNEAIDYALSTAKRLGAKIIFLHTLDWPERVDEMTPLYDEGFAFVKDRANAFLTDLVEKAKGQGLQASKIMADGVPFIEILRIARKCGADLIIMGTHGRTGLSRLMSGSQAERVVRQSPCPVLTVRSPQHQFASV